MRGKLKKSPWILSVGFKIGDVGRASFKGLTPLHDGFTIAGDPSYAPPELLYSYIDPDWNKRRLGCDAYLLGSIILFYFTYMSMTSAIFNEMDVQLYPKNWGGTFKEVLLYLRHAFNIVMEKFEQSLHMNLKAELPAIVRQLCDPDPDMRGNPQCIPRKTNPFSLEYYISRIDAMARKAELGIWRFDKN